MSREQDQPLDMWVYWRDKYGFVRALVEYYPNRLKADPMLQQAVYQANAAEAVIEGYMTTAMISERN